MLGQSLLRCLDTAHAHAHVQVYDVLLSDVVCASCSIFAEVIRFFFVFMLLIELAPETSGAFSLSNLAVDYAVVAHFKLSRVHYLNVREAVMMFVDGHVVRMQFA